MWHRTAMPKTMQGSFLRFARCVHICLQLTLFSSPTRIQVEICVFFRFSIGKPTFSTVFQYFRIFCHRRARAAILYGCTRRLQSLCSREVMLVMHAQIFSSPQLTTQAPCQCSLKFHSARGAASAMCSFPRDLRKPRD